MFHKADITFAELAPPMDNWCDSGHFAPVEFRRSGPESLSERTRFFKVSGRGLKGTYCEPCLVIANHMANAQRISNGNK
jgi:hypothetical protein